MAITTTFQVHFDEADPAGIAFSGGLFTKIHRCFESFINAIGLKPADYFLSRETIYPLRHNEAEYFKPLMPFVSYQVIMDVIKLSESSFQMEFTVNSEAGTHAKVRSTHVCCDGSSLQKKPIPSALREGLQKHLRTE